MKAVAYPVPRTKRSFSKSHCQVQPFQSDRKQGLSIMVTIAQTKWMLD